MALWKTAFSSNELLAAFLTYSPDDRPIMIIKPTSCGLTEIPLATMRTSEPKPPAGPVFTKTSYRLRDIDAPDELPPKALTLLRRAAVDAARHEHVLARVALDNSTSPVFPWEPYEPPLPKAEKYPYPRLAKAMVSSATALIKGAALS